MGETARMRVAQGIVNTFQQLLALWSWAVTRVQSFIQHPQLPSYRLVIDFSAKQGFLEIERLMVEAMVSHGDLICLVLTLEQVWLTFIVGCRLTGQT